MASAPEQHPLVRKLESIADLTPEERQAWTCLEEDTAGELGQA
jgi:hypothetical protein